MGGMHGMHGYGQSRYEMYPGSSNQHGSSFMAQRPQGSQAQGLDQSVYSAGSGRKMAKLDVIENPEWKKLRIEFSGYSFDPNEFDVTKIFHDLEKLSNNKQVLTITIPRKQRPTTTTPRPRPTQPPFQPQASKASVLNHSDRTEYKIEFFGRNFERKHLSVEVVEDVTLLVKAHKNGDNFEKSFPIPPDHLVGQIKSKLTAAGDKYGKNQILLITIPKEKKTLHVPISMEDDSFRFH